MLGKIREVLHGLEQLRTFRQMQSILHRVGIKFNNPTQFIKEMGIGRRKKKIFLGKFLVSIVHHTTKPAMENDIIVRDLVLASYCHTGPFLIIFEP